MQKLILLLVVAISVATVSPASAADQYLKATVTGTVQTQILVGPSEGRILTRPLNNQRIFDEFGVSLQDYQLVVKTDGIVLLLLPKHTGANLPTIKVIDTGAAGLVIDTKARAAKFQAEILASGATNVFKDVAGEFAGTLYYHGDLATGKEYKVVYSAVARGTDPAGGISTSALLKFKVVAQGSFVQQP